MSIKNKNIQLRNEIEWMKNRMKAQLRMINLSINRLVPVAVYWSGGQQLGILENNTATNNHVAANVDSDNSGGVATSDVNDGGVAASSGNGGGVATSGGREVPFFFA